MAFDKTIPAATTTLRLSNPQILANQAALETAIDQDHDFTTGGTQTGKHNKCTFIEAADIGTGSTGFGILGGQTVSGKPELTYVDEDDNSIQITSGGYIKSASLDMKDEDDMASDSASHAATQQSIKAYVDSGTITMTNKTLTSPVINTSISGTAVLDEDDMASDSATKLATQQSIKAYIDAQIASSIQDILGTPESKASNTIYQASTAGFAFGLGQPGHGNGVFGYIGASSPPASLVQGNSVYETGYGSAFICVPKNYYWTITGAGAVYWIPFGS